jgi:(p)ppGpp synthetase, RelA/SpoT family
MFTQEDNDLIQREFEPLRLAALKRCSNEEEYQGVLKAFEFANEAHKGVRRLSGEPYILHPIAVAKIVVQEIGLGYKSIVTALLHDIVEDTEYTVEDISRLFGEKIASLVDGLTKIKSTVDSKHTEHPNAELTENEELNQKNQEMMMQSLQAENFKRILLTLNDDVRVILIKLADRLHNLRTIASMPDRKKFKILSETMYIYIPLAHRLGLYAIKSEMENIWLKYSLPTQYNSIQERLNEYIAQYGNDIDMFISDTKKLLDGAGYKYTISRRTKTPYSIWKKINIKKVPFEQIFDLFAVRIVFEPKNDISERKQCIDIYTLISEGKTNNPSRYRDWVTNPKPNGYEALHCTLMIKDDDSNSITIKNNNWFEVQIRTIRMNDIAEKGVAAHWSYKGISHNENEVEKWLSKVRETLENPDANALQFLDEFRNEMLANDIYVFTPSGESKTLPNGATALDFAYNIHSQIGNKALAAKVNLKLVPLSYKLKNGDQVEIITADSQKPKREWLNFVSTPKSKTEIYEALKNDSDNAIQEGRTSLEKELAKLGITPQTRVLKKLMIAYAVSNKDELYSKIGTGLIDLTNLEKILKNNTENKLVKYWHLQFFDIFKNNNNSNTNKEQTEAPEDDVQPDNKIDRKKDYILKENPVEKSLSYIVAECCNPIPGDEVIGFLTDDNKVIVHKKECEQARKLASTSGQRIINAKWTKHTVLSFLAGIELRGIDRIGIVNDITKYITLVLNVNIRKIVIETHDGIFEGYIELYVHNTEDLDVLIKRLQKIKGIDYVIRKEIKH